MNIRQWLKTTCRAFLEYIRKQGCKDLPDEVKNKHELKQKLLNKEFDQEVIDQLENESHLPED
jgi:SOS response regulatory protein OraA/RecX